MAAAVATREPTRSSAVWPVNAPRRLPGPQDSRSRAATRNSRSPDRSSLSLSRELHDAVHTPDRFVTETTPVEGAAEPNQTQWISEVGELTQFGAFIEVLQPGCRSSIKHWHAAEDEMVYVLAGEITVVEGESEWLMRAGDAATFKAGIAVGHCLENRSSSSTRCLVVGTRAPWTALRTPITIGYCCVIAHYRTTYGWTWLVIPPTVPTRLVWSAGRAV